MAVFKTAEGEFVHIDERGREYGFYYRVYEDDGKDGLARAIVSQMPGSPSIADIRNSSIKSGSASTLSIYPRR